MSSTSKRSPSSITTCCVRGSWAKRTISSAVICRGLTVTSMPACSKTSTEAASWTIATVKRAPCTFASVAAKWFFMSSRIAKIATCASAIRSRSRKSGSKPVAL